MSEENMHIPFEDVENEDKAESVDELPEGFWENIADTLDKIEANTRGAQFALYERSDRRSNKNETSPRQPVAAPSQAPRQERQTVKPVAELARRKPAISISNAPKPAPERTQKAATVAHAAVTAIPQPDIPEPSTKKGEAKEIRRLASISKQQTNSILQQLKNGLAKLDSSIGESRLNTSSLGDLAGVAVAGPFWTAFKEIKDVVIKDGQSSEKSLAGLFKKTFPRSHEDKSKDGRKRNSKGQFVSATGGRQELKLAEDSHALAEQQVVTGKKRHDELIKTIKANKTKTSLFGKGGLLDSLRGRGKADLPEMRRDRRISLPDKRTPNIPGGHQPASAPSGKPAKPVKAKGRGKAGILAGAAALFGGSAIYANGQPDGDTASTALDVAQTAAQSGKTAAEKVSPAAASKTVEAGAKAASNTTAKAVTAVEAGAGKAVPEIGGKVAAKGAMGAARAIPIAGQVLAAGMALYDGAQGWNNTEMHQEAFGLKDGEEASTGQKASAAAANMLDMGGLLTGTANLLGFDVNTADLAKGIYDIGDKVTGVLANPLESMGKAASGLFSGFKGLFGGDDEGKNETEAEAAPARPKEETSALDTAQTAALLAAPAGMAASGIMAASKKTFPVASANIEPPSAVSGAASKTAKPIAPAAAAGVVAGVGAQTLLARSYKESEGKNTVAALGNERIPGLLEVLVKSITGLTEKLDEQLKAATNASENGGIFNIFGGAGYSGGDSSGGSGGSYGGGGRTAVASAAYSGLGDVVNMGETGGKGTAMISTGAGDHGGVSYGRSQLASKVGSIGTAMKWAKANGFEDIYSELAPLQGDATNRNGQFAQKWRQLAAEKGGRLEQFDRAYQKHGYYDPMMAKIRKNNPELAKRIDANPALQEQVLSTAVQYGQNSGRFLSAANEVLSKQPNVSDRDLLIGVQDIKARDVRSNFIRSSANVQRNIANRHANAEKQRLLAVQDRFEKGEIKIDPQTGTAQTVAAMPAVQTDNSGQLLKYDAASQGVRLKEDGKTVDLSTVKGVESLKLQHGVNIDKMHPEAVSRMASAASDYEKLTGQKLEISEGYRDYAEQVRTKKKHGNNAATPGRSTHGMGNTFDIAKSRIVEVENRLKAAGVDPVKFFEEHGLQRTAYRQGASRQNDESWHFEAADLRTAEMRRDRENLQSGKKTGAEYLTAEQKARYMAAPAVPKETAIAENAQPPMVADAAPGPVQTVMNMAKSASNAVTSPQSLPGGILPKEAQTFVSNVQSVAGDMAPLAGSLGKLLPESASPFLGNVQSILGQAAMPQSPSFLPNPSELFSQGGQIVTSMMQAVPQLPTRLPDPSAIMPSAPVDNGGMDFSRLEHLMAELLDVARKNGKDKEKDTEAQNSANIPMDFEDAYCFRFAHDMA